MLERNLRTVGYAWINLVVIAITVCVVAELEVPIALRSPALAIASTLLPAVVLLVWADRIRRNARVQSLASGTQPNGSTRKSVRA